MLRLIRSITTVLVLTGLFGTAIAAFQDPLDVPAMQLRHPQTSPMTAIVKAGDRLVAVGRRGVIAVSDDTGENWRQAKVPVSVDLTSVYFTSATNGWAVGHGGVILHSEDGGLTWDRNIDGRKVAALVVSYYEQRAQAGDADATRVLPDAKRFAEDGAIHPFLDVWFENDKVGYVVGVFNLILRTEDGGRSWVPLLDRTENPQGFHLYSVRGAGDNVYVVGEQGLVLMLDRSSQRLKKLAVPYNGTFFGMIAEQQSLLVYGLRGNALRTADLGKTWTKINTSVQSTLTGAAKLSNGEVVLVSLGGNVLISNDKGQTFSPLMINKPMPYAAVSASSAGKIAFVGLQGISTESTK